MIFKTQPIPKSLKTPVRSELLTDQHKNGRTTKEHPNELPARYLIFWADNQECNHSIRTERVGEYSFYESNFGQAAPRVLYTVCLFGVVLKG